MDFVIGLPRTFKKHDSIWVIVDRLTKSAHVLPVKTTYTAPQYAALYIKEIVRLHGFPCPFVTTQNLTCRDGAYLNTKQADNLNKLPYLLCLKTK